tara:strand:- start:7840 stop:8190 length:351 start_codon:yes stop_codon:yes gene_type:complete
MGKYPNKGMNALAKDKPEVAKKIMGYKDGGLSTVQKAMDTNEDGKVSDKEKQDYLDMMKSESNTLRSKVFPKRMRDGGMVKGYNQGGLAKGKKCPHRGTVRGTGAAIGGAKFTGVK